MAELMEGWTALIAPLAALGGVALGHWLQQFRVREESAERRRQEAAHALAAIQAFLIDSHPQRLTLWNAQLHQEHTVPRLVNEWQAERVRLMQLRIGHPSAQVRELAGELEKAVHRSFTLATVFLDEIIQRPGSSSDLYKQAMAEHKGASETLERLVEAIREK